MADRPRLHPDTCSEHDCWRTAPGGYCAPRRCYCGGCPWYVPIDPAAADQASRVLNLFAEGRRRRARARRGGPR